MKVSPISEMPFGNARKEKRQNNLATLAAGGATYLANELMQRYVEAPIVEPRIAQELRHPFSASEIEELNLASELLLDTTGLRQRGVRIINHNQTGVSYHRNRISDFINNLPLPNFIRNRLPNEQRLLDSIANGVNACYDSRINTILVNQDMQHGGIMHEIGHAYNSNSSFLWRNIQKFGCRASRILSTGIILYTLCTKQEEAKEGEELTKGQKAKNFIRKNSPALVFASILPKLMEETRASRIGEQLSRQVLSSRNLIDRVSSTNRLSYTTYALHALMMTACAVVARNAKDAFSKRPNPKKEEPVQETKKDTQELVNYVNIIKDNKAFSQFNVN